MTTKSPRSRGVGDTLAKAIKAVARVEPCKKCKERQILLNAALPYRRRKRDA